MAADMLAGPAMEFAFDLLFGSIKNTIEKAVICKEKLKKIIKTLEALGPLIKQMKECNMILGKSESELQSFVNVMKEGEKLVGECSKIKKWEFLKKSRYSDKLDELDASLNDLLKILQVQQARDGKETLILVSNINDNIESMKMARIGVCSQIHLENKYKIPLPTFTIGLDAPLNDLKKKLLEEDRSVFVLTAPGGFGKTTLARKLCGVNQIKGIYHISQINL